MPRANILLVDDRPENLLALSAILEPLDQNLISALSGEEALKKLLAHDVAVILLDVQMPGLDGFETAALIKQRARTSHIPIIFVTAISKDQQHVFRGYSAGAVDYIFKPIDADVIRSKVSVFIDLYQKTEQLKRQAELLRQQDLADLRRESEERYRFLADTVPDQVWTADTDGRFDYVNKRAVDYFGPGSEQLTGWGWKDFVHPDDLAETLAAWTRSLEAGEPFEAELRLRRTDGAFRWHIARAVPRRDAGGALMRWFGTMTDIDDRKRAEESQRFLVEAGVVLGSSLDFRKTLASVARLSVPEVADWCSVAMIEEDGSVRQLAVTHSDPAKIDFVLELQRRYPPDGSADNGAPKVIRTGEPEIVAEISDEMIEAAATDEFHLSLLKELGLRSYMCVPLITRERPIGAITFIASESGRRFSPNDLALAEELSRRAGMAIENAQLYREVEEQAQAARVLASVGDGVFLLAGDGTVRIWNAAAEAITGLPHEQVVGRRADEAIPGWANVVPNVPVATSPGPSDAQTVPLDLGGREIWLSISGVAVEDGTVYAFRDLTEEQALEEMRKDLVATVSHELRTPLAAIYGAAITLRRADLQLEGEMQTRLLGVVADESERLAEIVNDLLLASQLDSDKLRANIERCDPRDLTELVIASAKTHLPEGLTLELKGPKRVPHVAADPGQLRQVLTNLVENAIKYSPDGGPLEVRLQSAPGTVRFVVSDRGLGIPAGEERRIFEKFYRLDPHMSRGIGGTGLGLYICRELVRRVGGKIWVERNDERGSTFFVEIPQARTLRGPRKRAPAAAAER